MVIRLVEKNRRVARAEMRKFCDAVDAELPPSDDALKSISRSFHRILDKGESADVAFGLKGKPRGPSGGRPKCEISSAELELDRPAFERIDELNRDGDGMSIKDACEYVWQEFPDGPRASELRRRHRLWRKQRRDLERVTRSPFADLFRAHSQFVELLKSFGHDRTDSDRTDKGDSQ